MFVCLYVDEHISRTTGTIFAKFFAHVLQVAVTWCCSGGVVICYVLPVLRMTSCLHITREPVDQVRVLGVTLTSVLCLDKHVASVCATCF